MGLAVVAPKMMRSACFLVALVLCLIAERAHACGVEAPPYITVESVSPPEGATGIVRDAAIQIRLRRWRNDSGHGSTVSVKVSRQSDGLMIEGRLDQSALHLGVTRWQPLQPLAANTTYRVAVEATQALPLPSYITGLQSLVTSFTTSAELAPALELIGKLDVNLVPSTAPVHNYCHPCGYDCRISGVRPALYAYLSGPTVRGGFDWFGYSSWLVLSDHEPVTFNGPGSGTTASASSFTNGIFAGPYLPRSEVLKLEIPRAAHTPFCVAFNAWDAAGHWQSAQPLCIPPAEIEAAFAKLDASSEAPKPAADGGSEVAEEDAGLVHAADAGSERDSYAAPKRASTRRAAGGGCNVSDRNGFALGWPVIAMLMLIRLRRRMR